MEEANRENRRIIAGLVQRVPELEAARQEERQEASQEPAGGQERAPGGQVTGRTVLDRGRAHRGRRSGVGGGGCSVASVDRLTLVELIEAEKAKLSPEALEVWRDAEISVYLRPEGAALSPHEKTIMERMDQMPEEDQYIINVLTELRVGLYESDDAERRGEPSQPLRDERVISASIIKDRHEPGVRVSPVHPDEVRSRTVDQALARLREYY